MSLKIVVLAKQVPDTRSDSEIINAVKNAGYDASAAIKRRTEDSSSTGVR